MKKIIRFACILFTLIIQTELIANTVIVKGYVTDSSNLAVANRTVKIYSTDSTNQGCLISHTKVTNPNGYYIDTLTCSGDIRKLSIIVENCDGKKIIHEILVTTNNVVESNFIICKPLPFTPGIALCKAAFSYTSLPTGIKFNSAGCFSPAADSIISRTWTFGDTSSPLTGNRFDPTHIYAKPGIYQVCLKIKTKYGCESTYCITVVFTPESNICKVDLQISFEKLSPKKFQFFSHSTILSGDSIVQRIWKFGDGNSIDGNQTNPIKEYKVNGDFTVCLRARTAKGCIKEFCMKVTVLDTIKAANGCKATFTYTIKDSLVVFNSAGSVGSSPSDSIISRNWYYADSAIFVSLSGNIINPSYPYTKPGKYKVYLVITTKNGCESKYATQVEIKPIHCNVQVQFTTEIISPKKIQFKSILSNLLQGDSVIERKWKFGDYSQIAGNRVDPVKEFVRAGMYSNCLEIKTKYGCAAQFCKNIVIQDTGNTSQSSVDYLKIISINPNPVITQMHTTVYSRNNNVAAEIAIYDIYGAVKITTKKLLMQGNNQFEIATELLPHGPYFIKVSSSHGRDSKAFYKL